MTSNVHSLFTNRASMMMARLGETVPAQVTVGGDVRGVEGVFVDPSQMVVMGDRVRVDGTAPMFYAAYADLQDVARGTAIMVDARNFKVSEDPEKDRFHVVIALTLAEQ